MTNEERQSVGAINAITNDLEVMRNECASRHLVIDWEQRRYEIAKAVLPTVIQTVNTLEKYTNMGDLMASIFKGSVSPEELSELSNQQMSGAITTAVNYADALIEELKKK